MQVHGAEKGRKKKKKEKTACLPYVILVNLCGQFTQSNTTNWNALQNNIRRLLTESEVLSVAQSKVKVYPSFNWNTECTIWRHGHMRNVDWAAVCACVCSHYPAALDKGSTCSHTIAEPCLLCSCLKSCASAHVCGGESSIRGKSTQEESLHLSTSTYSVVLMMLLCTRMRVFQFWSEVCCLNL